MNATTAWKEALTRAREGVAYTDRQRRVCHEIRDLRFALESVQDAEEPLRIVSELGWYYPPREELESVVLGTGSQHLYTFSKQVHAQLPRVIALLREDPHTRRALISLVDPGELEQHAEHLPCLISAYFSLAEGDLTCTVHARSVDLLIGLPANLYQSAALARHVAESLGLRDARLTLIINSAHVFEDYDEQLRAVLQKP